jgi:hypothetical protein
MTGAVRAPVMSRTQRRLGKASLTVRPSRLRPTALKRFGANVDIAPSGSQASVQKCVEEPSPTSTVMETLNIDLTLRSAADGSNAQAESGSVLRSHSHLRRRAYPRVLRSGSPRPPWSLGAHTMAQAILQRPPETELLPTQRNARR